MVILDGQVVVTYKILKLQISLVTAIDRPVALGIISVSCLWSVAAWKELVSGDLLLPGQEVIVSLR